MLLINITYPLKGSHYIYSDTLCKVYSRLQNIFLTILDTFPKAFIILSNYLVQSMHCRTSIYHFVITSKHLGYVYARELVYTYPALHKWYTHWFCKWKSVGCFCKYTLTQGSVWKAHINTKKKFCKLILSKKVNGNTLEILFILVLRETNILYGGLYISCYKRTMVCV